MREGVFSHSFTRTLSLPSSSSACVAPHSAGAPLSRCASMSCVCGALCCSTHLITPIHPCLSARTPATHATTGRMWPPLPPCALSLTPATRAFSQRPTSHMRIIIRIQRCPLVPFDDTGHEERTDAAPGAVAAPHPPSTAAATRHPSALSTHVQPAERETHSSGMLSVLRSLRG